MHHVASGDILFDPGDGAVVEDSDGVPLAVLLVVAPIVLFAVVRCEGDFEGGSGLDDFADDADDLEFCVGSHDGYPFWLLFSCFDKNSMSQLNEGSSE